MPTVLRVSGYRFYFFSNERHEPAHVHVEHAAGGAKIWLADVRIAWSFGLRRAELSAVRRIVFEHRIRLQEAWDEHFRH